MAAYQTKPMVASNPLDTKIKCDWCGKWLHVRCGNDMQATMVEVTCKCGFVYQFCIGELKNGRTH